LATGLSLADAIIQIHNTAGIQTTTSEDTTETEGDTTKITDILRNKLKLSEMLDSLQNTVKNRFNNYTPDKVAAGLFPGFDGKTKKKSKPPGTDSNRPDAQLLQGNEETLLMINNDKVRKVWENLGVTKRAGNEFDQQVKSLMKKSEGKLSLEDARKQFMEKRGKNAGLYMGKGIDQIGSNLIKVAEQTGDIPSGIMQSFNNLKAEVAHAVQTGDTGGIALAMKRLDVDYKHAYKRAEDLRLRKRSSLSPDEAKDLAFIENLKKREKGGISAEQAIADAKKSMRNGMDELGLRGVQFTPLPSGMLDASAHEEEFQRFKKGVIEWRNVFMAHAQAYLIQHILADPIHSMSKGLWEAVRDAKNYLAPEYKNTIVDHLLVGMLARGTTQMILANPTLPFKMGGYAVRGGKSLYQFGLTNGLRVAKHMAPNSQTAQRLNAANKALNAVPSEHAIRLAAYQKGLRTKLWNQRLKPFKDIEDRTSRFVYNHGGGFVMRVGKKAMTNKNVQVVIKYAPIGAQAVAVGLNTWTAYSAWKAMRTDPMYQEWEKVSTVHNLGITESLKLAYQADNMDLTKLPPPDPETNTFIRRLTDAEKKRATDLVTARMMGSIEKGVTFVEGYTGKIFSITRIDPQELEKAVNEEIAAQEQHKYLIEALRERVKNAIKAQAGIESRTKAEEPVAKDDGKPTAPSLLIPIWEQ
jgi:hypothetical protein